MATGASRQLQVDAPSVSLNLPVAIFTTFHRPIDLPIDVFTHPYLSYRVPVSVNWFIDRLSKLISHFPSPSSNLHAVSCLEIDCRTTAANPDRCNLGRHRLDGFFIFAQWEVRPDPVRALRKR